MNTQQVEWLWLDARESVSAAELARVCGMSETELDELVGYGALLPLPQQPAQMFSAGYVNPLRTVGKLRTDFDLDLFTVALLLGYVDKVDSLERQVRKLTAQMPSDERWPAAYL